MSTSALAIALRGVLANSDRKSNRRKAVILNHEATGGDPESLVTIHTWQPRSKMGKLLAAGYEKVEVRNGLDRKEMVTDHENYTKAEYDIVETSYELVEELIERARPPHEEQARAALEGRIQPASAKDRFYSPPLVKYAQHVECPTRHLGDFEWADDQVSRAERDAVHARYTKEGGMTPTNLGRALLYTSSR